MDNQIQNNTQNSTPPPGHSSDVIQNPALPQQPEGKKSHAKTVIIVVIFVFILIGGVLGYQKYISSQTPQNTITPTTIPVTPTTISTEKRNVYEDKTNGYSFEYPAPYKQNQFGIATTDAMTLITPTFSPNTIDETINMIQKPRPGQESKYKISKETVNGFQVIKSEITIHFIDYTSEEKSYDDYYYFVYIALAPKKTLILSADLKYKQTVDQIISTIKVN